MYHRQNSSGQGNADVHIKLDLTWSFQTSNINLKKLLAQVMCEAVETVLCLISACYRVRKRDDLERIFTGHNRAGHTSIPGTPRQDSHLHISSFLRGLSIHQQPVCKHRVQKHSLTASSPAFHPLGEKQLVKDRTLITLATVEGLCMWVWGGVCPRHGRMMFLLGSWHPCWLFLVMPMRYLCGLYLWPTAHLPCWWLWRRLFLCDLILVL